MTRLARLVPMAPALALGADDCIREGSYGRSAGEAGGVSERNGIVGALGAERE